MNVSKSHPIKLGLVGAGGYWGPNWLRVLTQLKLLSAVCESDPARLETVKAKLGSYPATIHTSYSEMLALGLDGIVIVTPPSSHAELAIEAMSRGADVFIEKPLATSVEDCIRIDQRARESGRLVMVGHTFLYHPAIRKFKDLLPAIGQLRSIYTVRTNFGLYQKSGIMVDLLPHDIAIFNYLTGQIASSAGSTINPAQDVGYFSANFGSIACSAFLSWSYPEKTRKLIAVGDRGILEWDLSWTYIKHHLKFAEAVDGRSYRHVDNGTLTININDEGEPLTTEALHFASCIETRAQPMTSIAEGLEVVRVLSILTSNHVH